MFINGTVLPTLISGFVSVMLLVSLGCGGTGSGDAQKFTAQLSPVTGMLSLDGKPLAGVMVSYVPDSQAQSEGELATGITDESGKYTLMTFIPGSGSRSADGAVPGAYKVAITKLVMPDGTPVPAETTDADAEALGAKQLLPPKYSSFESTKLTAVVKGEPNTIDFELKSKP